MHSRRALLYVPGDDLHKINKAAGLPVDTICLDMEDGVAPGCKEDARAIIAQELNQIDFRRSERLARINAVGSGLEAADLAAALSAHPDGIVIPKVVSAEAIRWADAEISAAEARSGWPEGQIALLVGVESAMAVVNLKEIAGANITLAHPRLQALIFGSEDLAAELGAVRTRESWEVFHARSRVLIFAAAFGLQAIDMVNVDFHDIKSLRLEAQVGAQMGFSGKQIIHPNQVGPVQWAFTPSDEAVEQARRVAVAYTEAQAEGRGAFALDGKMVDLPIVKAAWRVLERAQAAEDAI